MKFSWFIIWLIHLINNINRDGLKDEFYSRKSLSREEYFIFFFYSVKNELAGLWWIWRRHNFNVFGDPNVGDDCLLRRTQCLAEECNLVWRGQQTLQTPMLTTVTWMRPDADFVKLDVDDSLLGSPCRIGLGGLIRTASDLFLVGFKGFAGIDYNLLPNYWL